MSALACPASGTGVLAPDAASVPLPDSRGENFRKHYLNQTPEGFSSITLLLEGLRCAGCAHTVEQVLLQQKGVVEADLNYSTHRTRLIWNEREISLEEIIQEIRRAGYNALPQPLVLPGLQREEQRTRERFPRLMVALFGAMNLMWIAIAQYAGYFSGMEQRHEDLLNLASFILATPVLFYSGWLFFKGAWRDLKLGTLGMDFQVALSTSLIYAYSCYAAVSRSGSTYFEAVAMFIAFLSIGKYLEQLGTRKILDQGQFFQKLMPFSVTRVSEEAREETLLEDIVPGWILEVKPGERVAVDGEVTSGEALVDESHLTGEPMSVPKHPGSLLSSGSICQDGVLQFRATRSAGESTLSRIIQRVEDALSSKPRVRVIADRLARYFVLGITLIATLTFLWIWQQAQSLEQALMHAMAVLIIACPCALSLATPIAVLTGLASATQQRILFRDGAQFETLRQVTEVVLDKTGTITEGRPEVTRIAWRGPAEEELLHALTASSLHPVSQTIRRYYEAQGGALQQSSLAHLKEVAGRGLQAEWKGKPVLGGNLGWLQTCGVEFSSEEQDELKAFTESSGSLFFLAVDGRWSATVEIQDQIREGSREAVQRLKAIGLKVHLLTGDHARAAYAVAESCEIDSKRVNASASPEDKLAYVQHLQEQGHKVLMVGDGLNDAPALALADIGIAMGASTDKALEISDLVLLGNNLKALVEALSISHHTFGLIRQNMVISLIYNLVALPLAIWGWVIPLVAALSMSLSSLLVVMNSLRVRWMLRSSGGA